MQIAEYVRGRQRIVEHVGSAHTEAGMLTENLAEMTIEGREDRAV
ncbi:hypothetical protein [Arthrobacter sp. 24S4-2]|nr:hypothetical protein [Arthrobacter sp. 24S4-2]